MGEYEKQDCPLCQSDAEFYRVDRGNRKYFNCPSCGYFQVSWRAEELLVGKPEKYKKALAQQSKKAPEDHLLTILMPSAKDREEEPGVSLVAKVLPKSELPLS